jgi:hypothetical protein
MQLADDRLLGRPDDVKIRRTNQVFSFVFLLFFFAV